MAPKTQTSRKKVVEGKQVSQTAKQVDSDVSDESNEEILEKESERLNSASGEKPQYSRKKRKSSYENKMVEVVQRLAETMMKQKSPPPSAQSNKP